MKITLSMNKLGGNAEKREFQLEDYVPVLLGRGDGDPELYEGYLNHPIIDDKLDGPFNLVRFPFDLFSLDPEKGMFDLIMLRNGSVFYATHPESESLWYGGNDQLPGFLDYSDLVNVGSPITRYGNSTPLELTVMIADPNKVYTINSPSELKDTRITLIRFPRSWTDGGQISGLKISTQDGMYVVEPSKLSRDECELLGIMCLNAMQRPDHRNTNRESLRYLNIYRGKL